MARSSKSIQTIGKTPRMPLLTAPVLASGTQLNRLGAASSKVILAHSLGNMVVSSAIADWCLRYDQNFLLNAAIPVEVFDVAALSQNKMTHPSWMDYPERLLASEWYSKFPPEDGRRKLSWRNRFSSIRNATNYYSPSEEVLSHGDGNVPGVGRSGSWTRQEMTKGIRSPNAFVGLEIEGGYGINNSYKVYEASLDTVRDPTPEEAAAITDEMQRTLPLFAPFTASLLTDTTVGSTVAGNFITRANVMSKAIPAQSFATGSTPINADTFDANVDMPDLVFSSADVSWGHSDFIHYSFQVNRPLYENWVERGQLK